MPIKGQLAVAAVTLNRVQNSRFPSNVCDVVRQGGVIRRHSCQFSWWCDGKKDVPKDAELWRRANTMARLSTAGIVEDPTLGALWYHADYVNPYWAEQKERVAQIGRHIFLCFTDAKKLTNEREHQLKYCDALSVIYLFAEHLQSQPFFFGSCHFICCDTMLGCCFFEPVWIAHIQCRISQNLSQP